MHYLVLAHEQYPNSGNLGRLSEQNQKQIFQTPERHELNWMRKYTEFMNL